MTNHFIQSLIDRHRISEPLRSEMPIVEPRRRARFEAESVTEDFSGSEIIDRPAAPPSVDNKFEAPIVDQSDAPSHSRETSGAPLSVDPQPQTYRKEFQRPNTPDSSSGEDKQIGRMSVALDPLEKIMKLSGGLNEQHEDQPNESTSQSPVDGMESKNTLQPVVEELNQRIASILQRLVQDQELTNHQEAKEQPTATLQTQNPQSSLSRPKAQFLEPQVGPPVVSPTKSEEKTNDVDTSTTEVEKPAQGFLQIPDWLDELQSTLTERHQAIARPSEPVVNVTIGRIEIRALQKNVRNQPKSRKNRSSVMSLEDYLKQRDKRRRA